METPLSLADRVRNNIALGESQFREFKSALDGPPHKKRPRTATQICRDVGEQMVGFANADGGDLLIGVEDDGTVTGVPHGPSELDSMLKAVSTHVFPGQTLPIQHSGKVEIEGKTVLMFSVAKGTGQIYQLPDGRCVRRRDRVCEPVSFDSIQFERQEARSREFERQFVDGATVNALDLNEVQIAANGLLAGLSVERYLQQMGLAEYAPGGLRLRMAALLLYAKDIRQWHPRSQIRIMRVHGHSVESGERYNVAEDETVPGNVIQLVSGGWEALRPLIIAGTQLSPQARFQNRFVYPEAACREALLNAIAHRDYSIQNGIEIFVFDDRMEFKSPGALLSNLKVTDLEGLSGAHESRNPLIARVLRENRLMRELGEGMRRIFEAMERNEFSAPEIKSNGYSFSVVLRNKSLFSERERQFLARFEQENLTRLQKRIVAAGIDGVELSQSAIYRAMNTEDRDTYDSEITSLRKRGLLESLRSNADALAESRKRGVPKSELPRFRIVPPENRTATSEKSGTARKLFPEGTGVYVGNLPANAQESDLTALFARFGAVRKILIREHYAVVWLDSETAATEAIEALYGVRISNHEVILRRFRDKPGRN